MTQNTEVTEDKKTITLTGHMPARFIVPWNGDSDYVLIGNLNRPSLNVDYGKSFVVVSKESVEKAPFLEVPKILGEGYGVRFDLDFIGDEIHKQIIQRIREETYNLSKTPTSNNVFNKIMRENPDYAYIAGIERGFTEPYDKCPQFGPYGIPYIAARFKGKRTPVDFRLFMPNVNSVHELEELVDENKYPVFQIRAKGRVNYSGI
jgi:hypothetical protein